MPPKHCCAPQGEDFSRLKGTLPLMFWRWSTIPWVTSRMTATWTSLIKAAVPVEVLLGQAEVVGVLRQGVQGTGKMPHSVEWAFPPSPGGFMDITAPDQANLGLPGATVLGTNPPPC